MSSYTLGGTFEAPCKVTRPVQGAFSNIQNPYILRPDESLTDILNAKCETLGIKFFGTYTKTREGKFINDSNMVLELMGDTYTFELDEDEIITIIRVPRVDREGGYKLVMYIDLGHTYKHTMIQEIEQQMSYIEFGIFCNKTESNCTSMSTILGEYEDKEYPLFKNSNITGYFDTDARVWLISKTRYGTGMTYNMKYHQNHGLVHDVYSFDLIDQNRMNIMRYNKEDPDKKYQIQIDFSIDIKFITVMEKFLKVYHSHAEQGECRFK